MRNPKFENFEDRRKILNLSGENVDKYKSYVMDKQKFAKHIDIINYYKTD